MTLSEIKELLVSVAPDIKHYFSMSQDDSYSFWEEYGQLQILSDGAHAGGWRFGVHVFTRDEDDQLPVDVFAALDASDDIAVEWTTSFEPETGYIHHLFDCEAV